MIMRPAHNLDAPSISRPIVLIGLMASGKTTVGRMLATRLQVPFVDNDDMLVRRTGRLARDIAEGDGLTALHQEEVEALVAAVSDGAPGVVAAAAGAACSPLAAPALDLGIVVYLHADPAALTARLTREPDDGHRPRLDLAEQYRERDPIYRGLADVVVEAGAPPAVVCNEIIGALAAPPPAAMPGA